MERTSSGREKVFGKHFSSLLAFHGSWRCHCKDVPTDTNPTPIWAIPAYQCTAARDSLGREGWHVPHGVTGGSEPLGPYKHSLRQQSLQEATSRSSIKTGSKQIWCRNLNSCILGLFGPSRTKCSATKGTTTFPESGSSWPYCEFWILGKSLLDGEFRSCRPSARKCWVTITGSPTSPLRINSTA